MSDIFHDLIISADAARVFDTVSTSLGLDRWWTKSSAGAPKLGAEYTLWFGPEYDWRARVTTLVPGKQFELLITTANPDWNNTRVAFDVIPKGKKTELRFRHIGWPEENEHYRISCYCWAMYLRVMKRWLEYGEAVEYEMRLEV